MSMNLVKHQHGKAKVRIGRVWKEGDKSYFVEWDVKALLKSDMEHAFLSDSNKDMTATDTVRNNCYFIAKQMGKRATIEEFATTLAEHFCSRYPLVHACEVMVEQKPWTRVSIGGQAHDHGFTLTAPGTRTAMAIAYDNGQPTVIYGGVKDLCVLKTTQSGYAGFGRCSLTTLPDVTDRMLATSVTATWAYSGKSKNYDAQYDGVIKAFLDNFFGPAKGGVYSASVQRTMFIMAQEALRHCSDIESISMMLPNIHFIPALPAGIKSDNELFIATSEPHGQIECTVSRKEAFKPMPRL